MTSVPCNVMAKTFPLANLRHPTACCYRRKGAKGQAFLRKAFPNILTISRTRFSIKYREEALHSYGSCAIWLVAQGKRILHIGDGKARYTCSGLKRL